MVRKSSDIQQKNADSFAGNVDFYTERHGNIFVETSKEQEERIKAESPFKHLRTWTLMRFMVKSNDDVRQEQFCM
jgi:hypothetical protein